MRTDVRTLSFLFVGLVLSACASDPKHHFKTLAAGGIEEGDRSIVARRAPGEALGAATCPMTTPQQDEKLQNDYLRTLDACRYVLNGYERDAKIARYAQLGLIVVGSIAGSVIVPVLAAGSVVHKSAIAGWGGISGVTNVASHAIDTTGLGPATSIGTRDRVRTRLDAAITKFTADSSDYCQRRNAVSEMAAACTSYALELPPSTPSAPAAPALAASR